jgi:hypothetical protein
MPSPWRGISRFNAETQRREGAEMKTESRNPKSERNPNAEIRKGRRVMREYLTASRAWNRDINRRGTAVDDAQRRVLRDRSKRAFDALMKSLDYLDEQLEAKAR